LHLENQWNPWMENLYENCGPYDSMHVRNWVEKLETFEALSLTELMCVEWDFFLCVDPCWDAQLMI
jgi:hypothetical protein